MNQVFRTLRHMVAACQRKPPSLEQVLLRGDHPAIAAELNRRIGNGSGTRAAQAQHGWSQQLMRECRALGLRYGAHTADTRSVESPWFATLSSRERAALAVSQATSRGSLARNIGMSINRVAVSNEVQGRHICPTLLPTQLLWLHVDVPRLMLGREALAIQGFPIEVLPDLASKYSEPFMLDLAGNMMTLPVLLALILSTLVALPWKGDEMAPPQSSEADVGAALASLNSLLEPSEAGQTIARAVPERRSPSGRSAKRRCL